MQSLEVSGAVRPLKWSLGVEGVISFYYSDNRVCIKLNVSRTSCFSAHLEGILKYYNPDFRLHLVFACFRNSQVWKGAIRSEIHTVFPHFLCVLTFCTDLMKTLTVTSASFIVFSVKLHLTLS